jgi:hypothetical protein
MPSSQATANGEIESLSFKKMDLSGIALASARAYRRLPAR